MPSIPLEQFASDKGQATAAQLLGMTQGALSKAIRLRRNITVTQNPDGSFTGTEVRAFPSQARATG